MAYSNDILTNRLCITPFGEQHLTDRYIGWLNNKALMLYSEQRHRQHNIETCRAYLSSFKSTPHYFWAIETNENDIGHIGNINAYVDEHNKLADIGIVIGEEGARKKGYGVEAWKAVCTFLFNELSIRKITAGTMAENSAMLKIMQQAGMTDDGVRSRHYLHNGQEMDIIYMALFRPSKR